MLDPVTARAPAKINLLLRVGSRRADGFHEVRTVYQAISLFDEVTARPAAELSVTVLGEGAGAVPAGRENLAVRAAVALAELAGQPPAVHLDIHKQIPVAAGLAGGSADAAAALIACDALWGTRLNPTARLDLAARLGSDVPFALTGGTAVGTGRGERLCPIPLSGRWHWVLAVADEGLSTPAVYEQLDREFPDRPATPDGWVEPLRTALRTGLPGELAPALGNDLQPAALSLRPELQRTLEAGTRLGAVAALVSGSGPTCAFLVPSPQAAGELAAKLTDAGVCRRVATAYGPVDGAAVVVPVVR